MKRVALAITLISILSATALAGDIPSGDFVSPPRSAEACRACTNTSEQAIDVLESIFLTFLHIMAR